jgi:hypothetical protein
MGPRWTADQVQGVAPDEAALRAARALANPRPWSATGCDDVALWGACQGSGQTPYEVVVDVTGPAYKCSCPSRKTPCKHALALLLRWADGSIGTGPRTPEVDEWLAARQAQAQRGREREGPVDEAAAQRRAELRAGRVAGGLQELERWLLDQVRDGLAGAARAGYSHWDGMAARLVDAQAPGAAGMVRRMGVVPTSGPQWPGKLLERYAQAWLLARGYARVDAVEPAVAATLRTRVGFPTPRDEVLRSGTAVRDRWLVLGSRDETDVEGLTTRRVWLHGEHTRRRALVLSFAMLGQPLESSLVPGTWADAELRFYPAAQELRALVAETHNVEPAAEPASQQIQEVLTEYAEALARDPWLDTWPVVLGPVVPASDHGWHLVDDRDDAVPLVDAEHWRLVAVSGGRRVVVGGEWSAAGLRPLTVWTAERLVRV